MSKFLGILLFGSLFVTCVHAEMADASKVRSVWDLSAQPCNGGGGNSMSRSPQENKIQKDKTIFLKDLGFKFRVPQFSGVDETIVKIFLNDRSRGVVDNYILISDQDLEAPFAAIVITELPKQMNSQAQAFSAVHTLESQLSMKSEHRIQLEKVVSPKNEYLQMFVKNRVGTHCFPTSDFEIIPDNSNIDTLGMSRFYFRDGKLIEFSVIVNRSKDISDVEFLKNAQEIMDGFENRLVSI